ncbi:MAG: phosphotransferase [Patescibacteria group bacterium]|jgi:Ser/Thr protein kinase RdoA (MazF antagonist)
MLSKQKLPISVLKKILLDFNLEKIETIESLATSGNIAYIIKTKNNKYFLRLSPSGLRFRSKEEITAEIELLDYLADNNFPVARPIINTKGDKIISWQRHYGYLREFVAGKEKINPTVKEIKKFGVLLGELHNLVENYKTKNKRQHIWDPEATEKYFLSISKNLDKQFVALFSKVLSALKFSKKLPSGSIHEDLGKRHVLWFNNKIVTVLDFDRFYFAPLVFDLGQAIRGWCFVNNWREWSQNNFKALISGYQSKRLLNRAEKKDLVDSIIFAVLERSLSFYSRYVYVTKDKEDLDYAWFSLRSIINIINGERNKIESILKNKKVVL